MSVLSNIPISVQDSFIASFVVDALSVIAFIGFRNERLYGLFIEQRVEAFHDLVDELHRWSSIRIAVERALNEQFENFRTIRDFFRP